MGRICGGLWDYGTAPRAAHCAFGASLALACHLSAALLPLSGSCRRARVRDGGPHGGWALADSEAALENLAFQALFSSRLLHYHRKSWKLHDCHKP